MKKIIHNIRHRSEKTKRHILHVVTIIVAVVLVLLWIYSLGTSLASSSTKASAEKDLQPLAALKDNFIGGYHSISNPTSSPQ